MRHGHQANPSIFIHLQVRISLIVHQRKLFGLLSLDDSPTLVFSKYCPFAAVYDPHSSLLNASKLKRSNMRTCWFLEEINDRKWLLIACISFQTVRAGAKN